MNSYMEQNRHIMYNFPLCDQYTAKCIIEWM